MPTFPTFERSYTLEGYSYEVNPDVDRTVFYTGNSRQRKRWTKRNDIFNVRLILSDAEFETFESFVREDLLFGSLSYTGPYYTSSSEYTGTLQIVDGVYEASLVPPSSWEVTYKFELLNRSMTNENNTYEYVNLYGTFG